MYAHKFMYSYIYFYVYNIIMVWETYILVFNNFSFLFQTGDRLFFQSFIENKQEKPEQLYSNSTYFVKAAFYPAWKQPKHEAKIWRLLFVVEGRE